VEVEMDKLLKAEALIIFQRVKLIPAVVVAVALELALLVDLELSSLSIYNQFQSQISFRHGDLLLQRQL
jgi:hypothetical protein